ncbi:MAG: enoyl-CoA hydratase/isomerase family protein [Hyphomicrobium sp.]
MPTTESPTNDIAITTDRSLGVVTFDRPKALNALTRAMRSRMLEAFPRFARDPNIYAVVQRSTSPRAFSAGADVREIITLARADVGEARRAFREEYALDWQIECFSKPTVSLIDGMVMGGGVGVSAYGTHRVAGDNYRWAMPETLIGLFPDVGVASLLVRMPGHVGMYLGLTGHGIGRADAYALGLITHCVPVTEYAAVMEGLAGAWPVDTLLDERHVEPGARALAPLLEGIGRCFSAASVEEIIDRLRSETGPTADWAASVVRDLGARSPLSLKITHRHIRNAATLDIRHTLMADYRLACRCLEGHDFHEGARAALIDKDGAPKWRPGRLEDVTAAMLDDLFAPLGADDLVLPTRAEMQEARA